MSEKYLKYIVWQAADQILESGQYPTLDLVAKKISQNPEEISSTFAEWKQTNLKSQVTKAQKQMLDAFNLLANIAASAYANAELTEPENEQTTQHSDNGMPQENGQENGKIPDHVAEMAARADKKAQYMAGGELVLTQQLYRHYRKTQHFSELEVQKQVDMAMEETAEDWEEEIENFSPAAMLEKFAK